MTTANDKVSTDHIQSAMRIFIQYKELAEKAIAQMNEADVFRKPDEETNSVYLVMKHLCGNMLSRWTDFLTTDGEKEWRRRDDEFEDAQDSVSLEELMKQWDKSWAVLFATLESLSNDDLGKIVTIRTEPHSVMEAINRQIAHYSYHVGQIVLLARISKGAKWNSLSIPRNRSSDFNNQMGHKI